MPIGFSLRGGPDAGADARRELAMRVGAVSPATLAAAELLLTELVTNAVRHGGAGHDGRIAVALVPAAGSLRVAVTDQGPGFEWHARPAHRPPGDGGYGLVLVDRLARHWGVEREPGSTTVWFELDPG